MPRPSSSWRASFSRISSSTTEAAGPETTTVVASTRTTVAVFFPMVLVQGLAGQAFGDLGLCGLSSPLRGLLCRLPSSEAARGLANLNLSSPGPCPARTRRTSLSRWPRRSATTTGYSTQEPEAQYPNPFRVALATVPVGKPANFSGGNETNEARAQSGAAFRVSFPGPSQVPPTGVR